jgi:PAS domain S-box-containing protein
MAFHGNDELLAADRWMRSVLASTADNAVILLSPEGDIFAWLGAASRLFGYSEAEALQMNIRVLFTPEDVEAQLDKQERDLALSCGRSEDDRWHVRQDGSRFWGSGVMEKVLDDDGLVVGLAKVLRDRTDVRTMVVTLQTRLQAAERENADRLKGIASLAHELRNQLTPLSNLLGTVEKTCGAQPPTVSMRRQIKTTSRLLDDLAEGSALVAASPRLMLGEVDVQHVIRHVASSMEEVAHRRGQDLKVTLPDTPILIEADEHRLDQILVNLISNACKFTPAGGTIQVSATVEDDVVAIRVEDNGIGIPPDVLPRLFELFAREERPRTPDGLGMGLYVVKQLAELHGGFVEGRSSGRDEGSVFTVRLPLRASIAPGVPPPDERTVDCHPRDHD